MGEWHIPMRHTRGPRQATARFLPWLAAPTSITAATVAVVHSLRTWSQDTAPEGAVTGRKGPEPHR